MASLLVSTALFEKTGVASTVSLLAPAALIVCFLLLTDGLSASRPALIDELVILVGGIAAINAVTNMVAFVVLTPPPAALEAYRLAPKLGFANYQGATTVSVTYTIFSVGLLALAVCGDFTRRQKIAMGVAVGALILAVLMTQSRGSLLAGAVGTLSLAMVRSRRTAILIGAAVVLVAAVLLLVPASREALMQRGLSYRPELWGMYLSMAADRPVLGYGDLANIVRVMHDGMVVPHPHNLLLSAVIRGGVIGLVGFLMMFGGGLYWAYRHMRRTGSAALFCMLVTLLAGGMFDYEILITYPDWQWITFWLLVGLAMVAERGVKAGHAPRSAFSRA